MPIAQKLEISRSELLERLAQGALNISTDKAEVSVTWKKGEETAIDPADVQGETAEESQVNDAITAETLSPKVSIKQNPLQAGYESLQQQLSEKESALASLQQELAASKQHKLAEMSSAIGNFQAQLTKLPYLENQLSQSAAKQRNYDALQQQSQEQLRTIKALREQLGQMQAVAGIGEAYLNKWRRPWFSDRLRQKL